MDEFTPSPYKNICYLGPVYEHRLMMEHTGANRGYGYVRFTNTEVREKESEYYFFILTIVDLLPKFMTSSIYSPQICDAK